MKRRQLLRILLSQAAAPVSFAKEDAERGGICWEADNGTQKIYLLGTLHALRAENRMPAFVDRLYQMASSVFLEFSPLEHSLEASKRVALKYGLLRPGENLMDYLPENKRPVLQKFLRVRPELAATLLRQKPWLAAMSLQNTLAEEAGFQTLYGVESYYTRKCVHDRKPLRLLEKVETPIQSLSALPMDVQLKFLVESLRFLENDSYASSVEKLYQAWRLGNNNSVLNNISTESMIPEIYNCLIEERNKAWSELIARSANINNSLLCVGIHHLYGTKNLVGMFQNKGFKINQFMG